MNKFSSEQLLKQKPNYVGICWIQSQAQQRDRSLQKKAKGLYLQAMLQNIRDCCEMKVKFYFSFIQVRVGIVLRVYYRVQWNPALRPPRYCDHFFMPRTKAHSFSYLKIPLIRPPRYYDHRPPLGVLSRYFLYKITPLIRPVKMLGGAAE